MSKQESDRGAVIGKLHVLLVCGCLLLPLHIPPLFPQCPSLRGALASPLTCGSAQPGAQADQREGRRGGSLFLWHLLCCHPALAVVLKRHTSACSPFHTSPFSMSQHCFVLLSLRMPDVACGFAPPQAISLHPAHAFRYFFY